MTASRDYLPVLDRIELAVEATCGAVMTLQSIDVLTGTREDESVQEHVSQAISHLRDAIEELRDAQSQGQTGLGLGFVLARDRRKSTLDGRPGQSIPRRTA